MPKDNNLKSYLQLHFIVFIWGFTAVIGALISLDALPLVWFRMAMATLFIAVYMAIKKTTFTLPPKTVMVFLFAGLIIALHWFTFFKAIKVSNVSVTLACLSTGAFFTSLLEPIFFKRKVIGYEVLFGLFVIVGLYIIFRFEGDYTYGIILGLASAFLSSCFSIINGKYANKYNPSIISLYEIFGGVFFLSLNLIFTGSFSAEFFILTVNDWLWLLVLASVCTAYAFIVSVEVMKYISPYTVMLTINLEPVYGIIVALLVFNEKEKMSWTFYAGAAIIIMTVIMNAIFKKYTRAIN